MALVVEAALTGGRQQSHAPRWRHWRLVCSQNDIRDEKLIALGLEPSSDIKARSTKLDYLQIPSMLPQLLRISQRRLLAFALQLLLTFLQ